MKIEVYAHESTAKRAAKSANLDIKNFAICSSHYDLVSRNIVKSKTESYRSFKDTRSITYHYCDLKSA